MKPEPMIIEGWTLDDFTLIDEELARNYPDPDKIIFPEPEKYPEPILDSSVPEYHQIYSDEDESVSEKQILPRDKNNNEISENEENYFDEDEDEEEYQEVETKPSYFKYIIIGVLALIGIYIIYKLI